MVFARIDTGIHTGAFTNALNKRNGLIGPHRSSGIVTIFLEIEYQQDTCARSHRGIGLRPGTRHNTEEMISLPNWITSVSVVIRSPEQSRLQRPRLPVQIFWVANEGRIRRFMNNADDALVSHCGEIRPHHVVVREIYYIRSREGTGRKQQKRNCLE